jgi:hypothetical protein
MAGGPAPVEAKPLPTSRRQFIDEPSGSACSLRSSLLTAVIDDGRCPRCAQRMVLPDSRRRDEAIRGSQIARKGPCRRAVGLSLPRKARRGYRKTPGNACAWVSTGRLCGGADRAPVRGCRQGAQCQQALPAPPAPPASRVVVSTLPACRHRLPSSRHTIPASRNALPSSRNALPSIRNAVPSRGPGFLGA